MSIAVLGEVGSAATLAVVVIVLWRTLLGLVLLNVPQSAKSGVMAGEGAVVGSYWVGVPVRDHRIGNSLSCDNVPLCVLGQFRKHQVCPGGIERLGKPPLAQWRQEETGGDRAQDGRVRQLGWMQAAPLNLQYQRLPVLACLGEGLGKIGVVEPVGTHAVLPLHLDLPRTTDFSGSDE